MQSLDKQPGGVAGEGWQGHPLKRGSCNPPPGSRSCGWAALGVEGRPSLCWAGNHLSVSFQEAACHPDVGSEVRHRALRFGKECASGYLELLEHVLVVGTCPSPLPPPNSVPLLPSPPFLDPAGECGMHCM